MSGYSPTRAFRGVLERTRNGVDSTVSTVRTVLARPTASDVAVFLCTLIVSALIGTILVGAELAVVTVASGVLTAGATVLLASDRPVVRVVGGALAVPVAVAVTATTFLATLFVVDGAGFGLFAGLSVWSLVVAGFAAGLVSWDRFGAGGVRRGSTGTVLSAVGVIAVVLGLAVPNATVRDRAGEATADTIGVFSEAFVVAEGEWSILTFGIVLFFAAIASRRAVAYIPLTRLAPPDRRERLGAAIDLFRRGCSIVLFVAVVVLVAVLAALSVPDQLGNPPTSPIDLEAALPEPIGYLLVAVLTSSALRLGLLSLVALATVGVLLEWTRRAIGRDTATVFARLIAPVVGGGITAIVLARAIASPELEVALESSLSAAPSSVAVLIGAFPPTAVAAAVLVAALFTLASMLFSVTVLRMIRILPGRATGVALAAGCIFVLAIGLVTIGRIEPGIWTAGAAFVLWDIGEYADGVRTELGRRATTLRAELVHVGGSVLSGTVVAGGAVVLYRRAATDAALVDPRLAAIALGAGLVAVALVTWAFRG